MDIDDEWETPHDLFMEACKISGIEPDTDVCATNANTKCVGFVDKEMDCLRHEFRDHDDGLWCNPPHSKTKEFVLKMDEQWEKWNIPIIMIIPANSICTNYFKQVYPHVQIHPIFYRPRFLKNGKPSKYPSRNSYFVVHWRKRNGNR